jgi:uncharacterized protein
MSDVLHLTLKDLRDQGERPVAVAAPAEDFPGLIEGGELIGEVSIQGLLSAEGDEASFTGQVKGRWRIECTRCLAPVDGDYEAVVEGRGPVDAGKLDLTDEVRQSIVLAQPMKIYCRADCRGFCQVCRKNRNLTDCGH